MKYVWELIDKESELPILVADSARELAKMLKVSPRSIVMKYHRYTIGEISKCEYRKILIDYDTREDDKAITVYCPKCDRHHVLGVEEIDDILYNKKISHTCKRCNKTYDIININDKYIGIL